MSEVSEKISKILEDPESLRRLSEIAESFIGNGAIDIKDSEIKDNDNDIPNSPEKEGIATLRTNDDISIFPVIGKLLEGGDIDNTVRLVTALKPYMSKHRRDSADAVLRILGFMRLAGNDEVKNVVKLIENIRK